MVINNPATTSLLYMTSRIAGLPRSRKLSESKPIRYIIRRSSNFYRIYLYLFLGLFLEQYIIHRRGWPSPTRPPLYVNILIKSARSKENFNSKCKIQREKSKFYISVNHSEDFFKRYGETGKIILKRSRVRVNLCG